MNDYKLYQIEGLDQDELIWHIKMSRDKFNHIYRGILEHDTSFYYLYNFFTIAACNHHIYELYNEMVKCMRDYNSDASWFQCWMNIHHQDEVLKSHSHGYPIHGYFSLTNHNTSKIFTDGHDGNEIYRIDNKPMQIYIGPGYRHHHVVVNEPYDDERITLGFDIQLEDAIVENFSFIPI